MSETNGVSPAEWALWRSFTSMTQHLARELDRRLQQDAGISQADYLVLLVLSESPDKRLRPSELGDRLLWEKSRVSHQVTRMGARGLVERAECDTDQRGTWIVLTRDGRRTLLGAMRGHVGAIRELFLDRLESGEHAALHAAATRVLAGLDATALESDPAPSR